MGDSPLSAAAGARWIPAPLRSGAGRLTLTFALGWVTATLGVFAMYGDAGVASRIESVRTIGLLGTVGATIAWVWQAGRSATRDLFDPLLAFPAAYVVWFALGSMNIVRPMPGTTLWDPVPPLVLALALAGVVAYAGGAWAARGPAVARPDREALMSVVRAWEPDRVKIVAMLLGAVILLSYAAFVAMAGIPVLSPNPALARLAVAQHGIVFSVLNSAVLAYVPLSFVWLWSVPRRGRAARAVVWGAFGCVLLMLFGMGSRGLVVEPVLLALIVAHYARRPLPVRALVLTGLGGSFFLSVVGLWRDVMEHGVSQILSVTAWGFPWWSLPFTYIYTYIRDPVVTFSLTLEVIPKFVEYQRGAILFSPLLAPLPGHQESYDLFFKRILHNDFVGMGRPATLLGSFYADFGVPGIVIGMLLFGALSQWTYARLCRTNRPFVLLMHVWIAHTALLSLFSSLIPYTQTLFVPLLIFGAVSLVEPAEVPAVRDRDARRGTIPRAGRAMRD